MNAGGVFMAHHSYLRQCTIATLLCGSAMVLRADFTYQETSQMTGGALVNTLKALGPLTRAAREPIVSTHIVKGNRMATITKDRVSVIDLDKENITTIDTAKKTYTVMTFAEMKQAMEDAAQRMQDRQKKGKGEKNDDVQAQFKVSAKATGQSKTVQGLNAKEMVITMAMEGKNNTTGDSGGMDITTDAWYAPVPGYGEVKDFQKKMAVKLGNIFGSGMQQISQMAAAQGGQANMSQGMEEVAKELSKIDGVPVESVIKMGASGTPAGGDASSAQPQSQPQAQPQQRQESPASALAGAALGRLGGFGRRKKEEPQEQPQGAQGGQSPQTGSASLMEMTMTLTSFSSGPADTSKFEVPAGYKQVEADTRRAGR
jgi:hypothetical protein